MKKYIIGHIKPDLDATVAPIALKYLYTQVECFKKSDAQAVLAGKANNETTTVFEKFSATLPEILSEKSVRKDDQFILVDHNESSQRHPAIQNDQIVEIYDHHKLSLNMSTPIFITTKPWGSSCTIIWFMMQMHKVKPGKKLAALMLSAILSDTVGFKSSTTTEKDKESAKQLQEIAEIKDLDALIMDILKAKSNIDDLTPKQIVTNDFKIFNFNGKKVLINQVETVEQDKVLSQKSQLLEAMQAIKKEQNLDYIFVAISDILRVNTKMLALSEEITTLEKAFGGKSQANVLDIGAKLSRKKDFAPTIENFLNK